MFRRIIVAAAASIALVIGTGGAALACYEEPPGDPICYGEPIHHDAVIVHHDAIPETTHEETVVDSPAIWQNFSPNKDQGPLEGQPGWPSDERGTWQHMDKDIPPGQAGPDGVYQNGEGNGSWFYRHAAVTHQVTVGNGDGVDAWDETISEAYDEDVIIPCDDDEPRLVVPEILWPNDECGTENDAWLVPLSNDDVTYWSENGDIIAALTDPEGTAWSVVGGSGWTFDDDNTIRFSFVGAGERGSVFTDVPCEEEPTVITPDSPTLKDLCGTQDDHYGLPSTEGVTYTRGEGENFRDLIATLDDTEGTEWGDVGDWTLQEDGTLYWAFSPYDFTAEPCPTGVPTQFSAEPAPPTCTTAATFNPSVAGGVLVYSEPGYRVYEFENVTVVLDRTVANEVFVQVFANEGFSLEGLSAAWFVAEDGLYAERTVTLAPATGTQSTNPVAACYTAPPPPGTPPTVVPPTTTTTSVVYYVPTTTGSTATLASTGSEGALALGIIAGSLALLGTALTVARRRYSRA